MRILLIAVSLLVFAACSVAQQPTKEAKREQAALAKLQKARDAVKADYDKHPRDPQLKIQFVKMNDALANATMTTDGLTPHQKYAGALRLFRQSVKTDPHDAEAIKWINQIESIYESMHRPIPN